jgi:hypothetical protein
MLETPISKRKALSISNTAPIVNPITGTPTIIKPNITKPTSKVFFLFYPVKNLIESSFKLNPPIIIANKVPNFLLPIKEQENKYYNQVTKKYMFFPNMGSF